MKRIAVYCASSDEVPAAYFEAARDVGRALAVRGIEMVYGGGNVGLMGAAADACLGAGGRVIGVIPQKLVDHERAHTGLSELYVVDSMHPRKMMMASLSSAFMVLPGGFGTLDELFEALTWNQLGYHQKPVGLLNVDGYFDHLLAFLDRAETDRCLRAESKASLVSAADVEEMLKAFDERRAHIKSVLRT